MPAVIAMIARTAASCCYQNEGGQAMPAATAPGLQAIMEGMNTVTGRGGHRAIGV